MYIYLDFIKDFSCRMCGMCCRKNWLVTVDQQTYEKNAHWFLERGNSEEFKQAFIPFNGAGGFGEYAFIAKKPQGGCWFLTERNRCRLHEQAGHCQLDNVCQIYPRYPIKTSRGLELTLSFSCPAVIDLACRREPLEFIRADDPPIIINPGNEVAAVFPDQQPLDSPLQHYFELECHFIDILQWRSRPLDKRLDLIDNTVKKISKLSCDIDFTFNLNRIYQENYFFMDACGQDEEKQSLMPEILLEHFLVNLVFKKLFYIYGLQKAVSLLKNIYSQIERDCRQDDDQTEIIKTVKAKIMYLELQYSHNKKALLEYLSR